MLFIDYWSSNFMEEVYSDDEHTLETCYYKKFVILSVWRNVSSSSTTYNVLFGLDNLVPFKYFKPYFTNDI